MLPAKELRISSLNLAGLRDWEVRITSIVSWLDSSQPDILLLQEACIDPAGVNQAMQLNDTLTASYEYAHSAITRYFLPRHENLSPVREGLTILSKYPVVSTEIIPLTKHDDDRHYRIAQLAQIAVDGVGQIDIAHVHFSNNRYADEQLQELLLMLRGRGGEWIIGGDFNIFDLRDCARMYAGDYISSADSHDYISFPAEGRRLDYFLVPKGCDIVHLNTVEDMSDHAALDMTIQVHK